MAFLAAPLGPPSFSGCPPTGGAPHPWGKEWTSLGIRRLMLSVNASCWWAGSQVNICSLAVDSGLWSQVYWSSRPPGQIWQGKQGGADLTGGCLASHAHPPTPTPPAVRAVWTPGVGSAQGHLPSCCPPRLPSVTLLQRFVPLKTKESGGEVSTSKSQLNHTECHHRIKHDKASLKLFLDFFFTLNIFIVLLLSKQALRQAFLGLVS